MKRALVLIIAAVSASAWADDLLLARRMIDGALSELSSHSKFTVVLVGKETDGSSEQGFRIDLAYQYTIASGRQLSKIELLNMKGDKLIDRIAGDGERIWKYDVAKNQYTSSDYGTADYFGKERSRLFQVLSKRSEGAQTFISRLMIDAFPDSGHSGDGWRPWRPNATVTIDKVGNIVCDTYTPIPNQLTYVLAKDRLFGYKLTGAKYYERSFISGRERTIEWEATIYPEWIPDDTSFSFVPPRGSRPVSVNEATGGGL